MRRARILMMIVLVGLSVGSARGWVEEPEELVLQKAETRNPIYKSLVNEGIRVAPERFVQLPPSLTESGADPEAVRTAIGNLWAPGPRRDRCFRNSTASPVSLKMYETKTAGKDEPLYHVDVVFVAYGDLEIANSEDFLLDLSSPSNLVGMPRNLIEGKILSRAELAARGISLTKPEEHYVHSRFRIWDRVSVSTTSHVQVTRDENSTTIAARIDPRFVDDPEFPTQWCSVQRDPTGVRHFGESQAYARGGFYLKLSRLELPQGALLVEYRQAFEEPRGWFGGENLLRSKLPLVVPEGARYFREQLRSASKQAKIR